MGRHDAPERRGHGLIDFLIVFAVALLAAFLLRTYVVEPYQIPTGSMEPTIEIGDMVLAEKVDLTPHAGDIVTFQDPADPSRPLVKRVIATEGQTVYLRDGTVYVDGVARNEPYTYGKPSYPLDRTLNGVAISYPYTVPRGCVWVMGDNRTNSADSRYFGAVPQSSITGRGFFTYWPLSHIGKLE